MSTVDVQVALDNAIAADTAVTGLIGDRRYSGVAPEGTALPYIRYGSSSAQGRNVLGAADSKKIHEEVIDIFSARSDKLEVLAIFEALEAVLHRKPIALPGGGTVIGRFILAGTVADPGGGMHAIGRYTPRGLR